ncbi:MAG: histidine phosphatase family protein, partial [Gammaproteobacteria bacterium]|nr:histidine phosphatase family protein [Gammaproteobacteria bacterium]
MPVYLIRHGQSQFNAAFNESRIDPMIFDAPLTNKGRTQAVAARELVADLGIKQVITSPLTRAIQTALCIFDNIAPITVVDNHRELLLHSCDVGRPPSELKRDFPMLSFDHLADHWWHHDPQNDNNISVEPEAVFQRRIAEFETGLSQIEERPLAIVGHGNAFNAMIGRMLDNCEIHLYQPDGD